MKEYYVGVMSGTSFDGLDMVLLEIETPFRAQQLAFQCRAYPNFIRSPLLSMVRSGQWEPDQFLAIHDALGAYFGQAIRQFLKTHAQEKPVRAIGLHGQTLWHTPEQVQFGVLSGRGTLQIGCAAQVRALTQVPTVFDFRTADMVAGGQGAPLAPFLDKLLFQDEAIGRVALNLGGIANLTFLPPNDGQVLAFDSGPANMVMDALMTRHPQSPANYDQNGAAAARGKVIPELLTLCKADPFFAEMPPKSTGRKRFGEAFLKHFRPYMGDHPYDDLLATALQLTVETVVDAVKLQQELQAESTVYKELIVSGGGARNPTMMAALKRQLPALEICDSSAHGVDPDSKEAWLMAALAWAHVQRIPGNIPEVTGAREAVVLGAYLG